jgi:hypothetical protein
MEQAFFTPLGLGGRGLLGISVLQGAPRRWCLHGGDGTLPTRHPDGHHRIDTLGGSSRAPDHLASTPSLLSMMSACR